jgi:hypothetical protein
MAEEDERYLIYRTAHYIDAGFTIAQAQRQAEIDWLEWVAAKRRQAWQKAASSGVNGGSNDNEAA